MENTSLKIFSELTASKDPIPGGGGVAAYVGSLASSLAAMVCNLTIGKKAYLKYNEELEDIKNELDDLRINLLGCIEKDGEAFKPLAEAYSLPKDSDGYEEKLEKCLLDAANSPMNILKYTTRVIELDERLASIGSKISVSDAATSVMLAHGVLYAAYINIIVNTRLMKNTDVAKKMNDEALALVNKYSKKALNIFDEIYKRLTND